MFTEGRDPSLPFPPSSPRVNKSSCEEVRSCDSAQPPPGPYISFRVKDKVPPVVLSGPRSYHTGLALSSHIGLPAVLMIYRAHSLVSSSAPAAVPFVQNPLSSQSHKLMPHSFRSLLSQVLITNKHLALHLLRICF